MRKLLASTAVLALFGCAQPSGWGYVGPALTLPDGHSSAALISGSVCADPNCIQQDTVTGDVVTSYDRYGRLTSVVQDVRPVVAPAGALAWGQVLIPAAATVGAGELIRSGEIGAAQIGSIGNLAAATANGQSIGQGLAAQKSPTITNTNLNVTSSSAASSASASASAAQSQQQQQQQKQTFSPKIWSPEP